MSESTSLREAISRAARGSLDAYCAQPNDGMQRAEEDVIIDAVLAVLKDLDGSELEEIGRRLNPKLWTDDYWKASRFVFQMHAEPWENALERARRNQLEDIRRVFAAAFGGEQA